MSDEEALRQAIAQGFARAAELFPEEIVAAARQAAKQRAQLSVSCDLAAEPWPPMVCATR